MQIKYNKPRGQRIKKQFWHIRCRDSKGRTYWWSHGDKKWLINSDKIINKYCGYCNVFEIKSLKSAIRHIKKHSAYMPKDTRFKLISSLVGHDIEITI